MGSSKQKAKAKAKAAQMMHQRDPVTDVQNEAASTLDAVENGEPVSVGSDTVVEEEPYADYEADLEEQMEEDEDDMNEIIDGLDLDDSWEVVDGYDYVPVDDYMLGGDYGDEDFYEIDVTVPEDLATPVIQDIVDEFDAYYPADNSTTVT